MGDTLRAAAFLDTGGTGKTTTVAHVGVALVEQDYDFLLLDLPGTEDDPITHRTHAYMASHPL
ncbi:nucleotide-binding protein [Halorhabdus rudnickae]|uniref:nucleotide-binding protein n=1 Tax=Halorhabdus rudnickae TaxID=1775544 RepID=UPI00313D005A